MALIACRECEQQVSTEAVACPHCGVGTPAHAGDRGGGSTSSESAGKSALIGIGSVVVLVGLVWGGYHVARQHGYIDSADRGQVQQDISQHFANLTHAQVQVRCPSRIPQAAGAITDCTMTRLDNGKTSGVRVTADDSSGHYHYQADDPFGFVLP